jgi:two-component system sensor kinase FixL
MRKRPQADADGDQALHDLRVADARWRAVLGTIRDAIIAIDRNGTITLFNPAAEQVFGYRADEVLGHNVTLLMPEPYRSEHDGYVRRYHETGERRAIGRIRLVQGLRKSGEAFAVELSVSESRLGSEVLYTAVLRDVSERQAAELELRELQRIAQERGRLADIGAITAKVVHDLGNPLAALSMQAQLILRRVRRGDFQPAAPVQQPVEQILATIKRLEALVREFSDFTRDQRLKLDAVQLMPMLASCVELWHALAGEHGIALVLSDRAAVRTLRGDEVMLRRVLDNLIKNAIEAIGTGPGEVTIETAIAAPGRLSILVSDTGRGVPENVDVFRLFETTKAEGTGIGLAVAKQIVNAHGGAIDHAPRSPCGTTFRIELPVEGPPAVTPAPRT